MTNGSAILDADRLALVRTRWPKAPEDERPGGRPIVKCCLGGQRQVARLLSQRSPRFEDQEHECAESKDNER
jgi:hypothetical protein